VNASSNADAEPGGPGLWTALRLIAGWLSVAMGAFDLITELDRPSGVSDGPYLVFHGVWLAGGIILLALARIGPEPRVAGYVAGAVVTVAGMIISAVPATTSVCCMSAFAVRHGYPFVFLARDAGPDDARRWHLSSGHALADLVFWACLGLIALIVVSFARRPARTATSAPQAPQGPPEPEERQDIEHRGQPRRRTVGPLP
jgi:hypothetical protein